MRILGKRKQMAMSWGGRGREGQRKRQGCGRRQNVKDRFPRDKPAVSQLRR